MLILRSLLLKGLVATWCCDRGRKLLPRLPELPAYFMDYVNSWADHSSSNSRKVNNLFGFSSIGVEGQFKILLALSRRCDHGLHLPQDLGH